MVKTLVNAIEAHGGLARWKELYKVQAKLISGGHFLDLVHIPQDYAPRQITTWLHKERVCIRPVGDPDHYADIVPNRVVVKTEGGETVLERKGTPDELHHHLKKEYWDPLDRLTFTGLGMWTYFTSPFFMTMPGFTITEIESWSEKNETWHGVKVEFPPEILSHSHIQRFYFGDDFLLRRHDYRVDVDGGFWATQYVHDIIEVDGIKLPTKRRAYKRSDDGSPIIDQLMLSMDFSEIKFT